MTAIAAARAAADTAVLFDAGDQFPSPSFPSEAQPALVAELMNRMAYDAMAPGNHDFDEGLAVLRGFVVAVDFPVLMANVDLGAAPRLADRVEDATIIERGGVRLGLIGLITTDTQSALAPDAGVAIAAPVDAVQAVADRLTSAGVNKINVLSHCGLWVDTELARKTTGIDGIVGGHSHSRLSNKLPQAEGPYPTKINGVAIVHACPFGRTLGVLKVTFDDLGNLVEAAGDQILLDGSVV